MNKTLYQLIDFAKNLTLLYVEDDIASREQTLSILKLFFVNIIVAVDGYDGLEKYKQNKIDFIITDINMPNLNGIKMIEEIRKDNKSIPMVVVSAHSDTNFFLDSIQLGVDGYLMKPLVAEQFTNQLSKNIQNIYSQTKLKEYQNNLESKVKEQVEELRQKDKILIHQTKLATMGEMIDIIAHQWKQPINVISMNTSLIWELYSEYDVEIKPESIKECHDKVSAQIKHLMKTLNDFRSFFRPNENIENILISDLFDSILLLLHDELMKHKINITIDGDKKLQLYINPSEIKHIFINLINNAKDAFIQNNIQQKEIKIKYEKIKNDINIYLEDNAGGIPENIIDDIFNANFTTKSKSGGTGMGLYMSKFIAKKNHANICVNNIDNGAKFILSFKQDNIKNSH